jgi:hypothetical protein
MISSEKVSEIFGNCLFKDNEIIDGKPTVEPIYVEGITLNFGLHPERVNQYSEEIGKFISELPEPFKNGWSFLNLCQTKDGEQWTGIHKVCEELMVLGIATNKMKYCSPKEIEGKLPGGVPYIQVI